MAFNEIDVSRDSKRRAEMTKRANGGYTVPQIFIGATHVGGCDDLYALDGEGKLDPLLDETLTRAAAHDRHHRQVSTFRVGLIQMRTGRDACRPISTPPRS